MLHLTLAQAGARLVEDASAALTLSLRERSVYVASLPAAAQSVCLRSRVAFPFTSRGSNTDGCGAYGRQFRDGEGRATRRSKRWYVELMKKYAVVLEHHGCTATARELQQLATEMGGRVDLDSHEEVMQYMVARVSEGMVAEIRREAGVLHPVLEEMDASVGVLGTKLYDAKLVLSAIAIQAADSGVQDAVRVFGFELDSSTIADAVLVHDVIMSLMTLHLDDRRRYRSCTRTQEVRVALEIVKGLVPVGRELFLCDTGADPNEDDVAAILVRVNANLLADGTLDLPAQCCPAPLCAAINLVCVVAIVGWFWTCLLYTSPSPRDS
eukprot:TRINITY_DN20164_c0_g1_i2.p1 TRINITY_DN20164_c0_g1~~TRINITY_DN20164_c0_g1_i2.p1  ORF type:complete len:325 (-),score=49.66 TRINITY_DN20164_c0_g1_i2:124-1098(-)